MSDPRRWRELAAEALAQAQQLTDPAAKVMMVWIAVGFERMAQQAEREMKRDLSPAPK